MNGIQSRSKRRFMTGAAGLSFGVIVPDLASMGDARAAAAPKQLVMNSWVTLSTDGTVFIMSPATEMGQGSLTSIPVILADAMDADWSRVRLVAAPPNDRIYGNPRFANAMYTAGSATVTGYFTPMRQFGQQVRYVLMDNAAQRWNVPLSELATEPGVVVHAKSGRRLTYGEIAAFAKIPEKAPQIALEPLDKAQWRLVGTDITRVDVPGKVNGTAQYSIDVQVPRMAYGAILRQPRRRGMAMPLVAPAISNAVFNLTRVRLRQQPMLPERVQGALLAADIRFAQENFS